MALRRYRRVRRPLRRFRRRRRKFFRRKSRVGKSDLLVKLTKIDTVNVDISKINVWSLSYLPTDFSEYNELKKNFEYCVFLKERVTIYPMQNIANNSTSQVPAYLMAPWHRGGPASATFNTYLTIDRAKIFRGTQVGSQTYVPSVLIEGLSDSGGGTSSPDMIQFRPKIYISNSQTRAIRIYNGIIAFQGNGEMTGTARYNVKHDVWVVFKKQNTLASL
ncbi:capsid protein [Cyclovirus PK6197]|nr:capsid protein [Cyclovirus PK6197]